MRLHQVNGYLVGVTRFSASIDQTPKVVAVVAVGSIPTLAAWNEIQRGSYVRQKVFGEFPPFGGEFLGLGLDGTGNGGNTAFSSSAE